MPFYYINVLIDINIKSAAPKKWDFCPNMSPNLFPTMKPNPDIIAVIIPISTVYTKTLWKGSIEYVKPTKSASKLVATPIIIKVLISKYFSSYSISSFFKLPLTS